MTAIKARKSPACVCPTIADSSGADNSGHENVPLTLKGASRNEEAENQVDIIYTEWNRATCWVESQTRQVTELIRPRSMSIDQIFSQSIRDDPQTMILLRRIQSKQELPLQYGTAIANSKIRLF